jgi:ABC-type transport system substrate-binding protein
VSISGGAGAGGIHTNLLTQDPFDNFKIVGDTIDRWEFNQDNTKLTLHVRPGVKWHDGTPFTAKDVVHTLDFYRNPPSGYITGTVGLLLNQAVRDVVEVNNETVELNLKQLTASFINEFSGPTPSGSFKVLPAHLSLEETSKKAMGTGPFKLKSFDRDISVEYVRNPDYYLKDDKGRQLPYLDGIKGFDFNDQTLFLSALRTGRIKHTDNNNSAGIERGLDLLRKDVPGIVFDQFFGGAFGFSVKNTPPFSDPRVLDAINLFLDRKLMGDLGFNGLSWPWGAGFPLVPASHGGLWSIPDEEIMARPGYRLVDSAGKVVSTVEEYRAKYSELKKDPRDVQRARELLQQAGIKQGEVKFEVLTGRVSVTRTTPPLLAQMKELFGATWTSRFVADGAQLSADVRDGRWIVNNSGTLGGFGLDEPRTGILRYTWGSSDTDNPKNGGWPEDDPQLIKIKQLFEEQELAFDVQRRQALIQDLQRAIMDYKPKIFTNHSIGIVTWWPEFRGYPDVLTAQRHHINHRYDRVWIAK